MSVDCQTTSICKIFPDGRKEGRTKPSYSCDVRFLSVVDVGVFSSDVAEYAAVTVRIGVVYITVVSVYVRRSARVWNAKKPCSEPATLSWFDFNV